MLEKNDSLAIIRLVDKQIEDIQISKNEDIKLIED